MRPSGEAIGIVYVSVVNAGSKHSKLASLRATCGWDVVMTSNKALGTLGFFS